MGSGPIVGFLRKKSRNRRSENIPKGKGTGAGIDADCPRLIEKDKEKSR